MLVSQIIESGFPHLSMFDKVVFALELMEDYDVLHLPVIVEEKFAGIISKDDLMDSDETAMLASLQSQFIHASVLSDEHFLSALKQASQFDISIIPVVNKTGEIQGIVTQKKLVRSVAGFFNIEEPGGVIVIEMDKRNFSFNNIGFCSFVAMNAYITN